MLDQINQDLRGIIRGLLGMPANSVRPANQSAPTGNTTEQFATVLIPSIEGRGQDEQRYSPATGNDITETTAGQRRFVASVQFFRGDAMSKATRLGVLIRTAGASTSLQAVGLGFIRASPVRNLSAIDSAAWESRAQIELEFYCIASEQVSAPTYGTFPISVDPDGPQPTQAFEVFEP